MQDTLIQWASYWQGSLGWFAITGLFLLGGFIIVPRIAVCVLAGLTFGLAAFPLALLASIAGALMPFLLARYFFQTRFQRMLQRRPNAKLLADAIDADGWRLLFLLRLASPVPGPVTNYAFALSRISVSQYIAATLFGIIPQIFAFVYLGAVAKVAIDDGTVASLRLAFGISGAVVLLLIVAMVTRRVRQSVNSRIGVVSHPDSPIVANNARGSLSRRDD